MTGSSKTEILHQLDLMGEQILDLEMLSNHKGSVFGALGQDPQPTNEQFENNIYSYWSSFNHTKRIWIEDESRSIGSVIIPDPLFEQMSSAPMIRIIMDQTLRIQRLVKEYAGFDKVLLIKAITKISEKLGGTRTKQVLEALENSNYKNVAGLVLDYYDKAYENTVLKRKNKPVVAINLVKDDPKNEYIGLFDDLLSGPKFSNMFIPLIKIFFISFF